MVLFVIVCLPLPTTVILCYADHADPAVQSHMPLHHYHTYGSPHKCIKLGHLHIFNSHGSFKVASLLHKYTIKINDCLKDSAYQAQHGLENIPQQQFAERPPLPSRKDSPPNIMK